MKSRFTIQSLHFTESLLHYLLKTLFCRGKATILTIKGHIAWNLCTAIYLILRLPSWAGRSKLGPVRIQLRLVVRLTITVILVPPVLKRVTRMSGKGSGERLTKYWDWMITGCDPLLAACHRLSVKCRLRLALGYVTRLFLVVPRSLTVDWEKRIPRYLTEEG